MVIVTGPEHWQRICEVYHKQDGVDYKMSDVTEVISILNNYVVNPVGQAVSSGELSLPSEWYDCGQDALMRMQTGSSPITALFYLMEPSVRLKPVMGARRAKRYDTALFEFIKRKRDSGALMAAPTIPRLHPLNSAGDFSNMLAMVYVMNRLAGLPDRILNR